MSLEHLVVPESKDMLEKQKDEACQRDMGANQKEPKLEHLSIQKAIKPFGGGTREGNVYVFTLKFH